MSRTPGLGALRNSLPRHGLTRQGRPPSIEGLTPPREVQPDHVQEYRNMMKWGGEREDSEGTRNKIEQAQTTDSHGGGT